MSPLAVACTKSRPWLGVFASLWLCACQPDSGDDAADEIGDGDGDDGTGSESPGDGDGDGDGDGNPGSLSCTMLPPPIAQAMFDAGGTGSIDTPNSVAVVGLLDGGTGPYVATWAGAKTQFFDSPELASSPAEWAAEFTYSSETSWPDDCPAAAALCNKSDKLSFSFVDKHTSMESPNTLSAQASLCVDLNRSEAVCPLPVVLDSVTATPDPNDPSTLEFQVALTHPDLDCSGLEASDGVTYTWMIDDGADGLQSATDSATVSFAKANVLGQYFRGSVEVACAKTYDNDGTPTTLDLRASTEFYVDCH